MTRYRYHVTAGLGMGLAGVIVALDGPGKLPATVALVCWWLVREASK